MRRQENYLDRRPAFSMPEIFFEKTEVTDDVAEVLGISKSSAYVLVKEKGFPKLKIGARVVVPREKFIEWINKNTSK